MTFKKGQTAWNKGKGMSDETKIKLSNSLKGRKAWNKGKKFSKEIRQKISEAHSLPENSTRLTDKGYKLIKKKKRWIKEHHLIWCKANNFYRIPRGCVIHHLNLIKTDNRIENLQLLDNGTHSTFHNNLRSL